MSYLRGNPYKLSNENGETYIPFESKADIVDNIYEKKGQFVILEIVPYEDAGIMEMLVGTARVKAMLEVNKEALFEQFKDTAIEDGANTIVTVGGSIASYHPFDIYYDSQTGDYTLSYPNNFISSLVNSVEDLSVYKYLLDNVEVRTVVAGELTEKDLEDVSLIYVSNYVQDTEVVKFNKFIDGEIKVNELNSVVGIERIQVYEKTDNAYNEYILNDASSVWYDSYIKNDNGEYISNDMSWDMVENVIEYIYAGNDYTDGQPIPSIINYGTPVDKTANVYKLMNLMVKTSNEENAEFNGMSMYYKDVMASVKEGVFTYEGKNYSDWSETDVPLFDIRCVMDKNYVSNFSYVMQGSVDDMLFSIGTPASFENEITDNGSASARDVAEDGDNTYTSSEALKYLLNGGGNVEAAYDSSKRTGKRAAGSGVKIRVLEIQPCQDFLYEFNDYNVNGKDAVVGHIKKLGVALGFDDYSSISNNASSYQSFLNKKKDMIEFKCVTPQELNGLNEDLIASYDIIVIGARTGQMTTNSSGKTIWNDKNLDGYVYLAYGDIVKGQDFLLGHLPRDFVTLTSSQATGGAGGYSFESSSGDLFSTKDWKSNKYIYTMRNSSIWSPLLRGSKTKSKHYIFKTEYIYKSYANRDAFYQDSNGNTRRISNDITEKKLKELMEYLSVSRPIVLSDSLYNCPTSGSKEAYPTSNMYKFVDSAIDYDYVIKYNDIEDELKSIINDNVLEIVTWKMEYEKGDSRYIAPPIQYESNGLLKDSCIVKNIDRFYYNVTFKAKPGTKYYIKAIVDKDTDGRFEPNATIDDFNEVYYSKKIVATAETVSENLSIRLPEGYNGMFGWKILIEELGAGDVRVDAVSEQGFTVVSGDEKRVKALQIGPTAPTLDMSKNEVFQYNNKAGWSEVWVYFWTAEGKQVGNAWPGQQITTKNSEGYYEFNYQAYNNAAYMVFSNGKSGSAQKKSRDFRLVANSRYDYIAYKSGVVNDPAGEINISKMKTESFVSLMKKASSAINYNIQIDYITADAFEKKFEGKKYTKGSSYGGANDYLKQNGYNMVIFGFKDSWGGEDICNDYGAMDCIVDYIEHGGSVLMSHDVLTFYNNPNYGICLNGSKKIVTRTGKNGSLVLSLKLRSLIGMDAYNVSTIPNLDNDTLAKNNVPMTKDGNYIQDIQGFTDWHIYRYNEKQTYSDTKSSSVFNTLAPWKGAGSYMPKVGNGVDAYYDDVTGPGSTMVSTVVNEINRGQISMYPFNTTTANGTLTIANTHPQYFRLDMEADDLVVWYTIGDSGKTYNKFYVDSGKDASNNYYIYSKGNITYTGAGHSTMNKESELKLFVNTVIRAASAGNFVPKITVLNGSSTKDADTFVIFPNALDDIIQVDFVAFDEDLATREVVKDSYTTEEEIREHIGRFTSGKVYYVTPSGDKKILYEYSRTDKKYYLLNGEPTSIIISNPFASKPLSATDADSFRKTNDYKKASEKDRNMYDCYVEYTNSGSVDLAVEVSDHDGATGKSTISIVEHALFDLD